MDTLLQDLRFGWRSLRANPSFTLTAVVCLALGIGATVAVYTLVHATLIRPLPIPEADRVVALIGTSPERMVDDAGMAPGDLREFAASGVFESLGAMMVRSFNLTGGDRPERVQGASVTPEVFTLLGVEPAQGRGFLPGDAAVPGFEEVVLLSHRLWQTRFGGAGDIVGRSVHLNGRALTVVGVMPPGFRFPETEDIWLPLAFANPDARDTRPAWGVGRLAAGVALPAARERVAELHAGMVARWPDSHRGWEATLLPYRHTVVDAGARRGMWAALGAVGFVLLIACANVANLMMARGADRERELSVRAALGAGSGRLVRQLLTESVLLAGAGGLAGIVLAAWWVDLMTGGIPEEQAFWIRFSLDPSVLGFAVLTALGTGVLFGTLPALQGGRTKLHDALRQGARAGDSRGRARLRSGLVAFEVALSVVLLSGTALMVQSFLRLQAADAGFDPAPLVSMRVTLSGDAYDPVAARAAFWEGLAERLREIPGISQAAVTGAIPADDGGPVEPVLADGSDRTLADAYLATVIPTTSGLPATLGLEMVEGRDFRREEVTDTAAAVAIVGAALAERLWGGASALGRVIRVGPDGTPLMVVGVAPDLQYEEFGEEGEAQRLQLHVPYQAYGWRTMAVLARSAGPAPATLREEVRATVAAADGAVAPYDVLTMADRRRVTRWTETWFVQMFGTFSGLALVLALVGIYGIMAYAVARRRRELGIRMALGARPGAVVALVLRGAGAVTLVGVGAGLAGAALLTRGMESALYQADASDPRYLVTVALLLAATALLASWIPARRAAGVDPNEVLREE